MTETTTAVDDATAGETADDTDTAETNGLSAEQQQVVDELMRDLVELNPKIKEAEQGVINAAARLKSAKALLASRHGAMADLVGMLEDAHNGTFQKRLPFNNSNGSTPERTAPKARPVDQGALQSVDALVPHGITAKMAEKLIEHEITTVGKLEKQMRENEWWHRDIKGFGQQKVDKLSDALFEFRKANPVPSADDEPKEGILLEGTEGEAVPLEVDESAEPTDGTPVAGVNETFEDGDDQGEGDDAALGEGDDAEESANDDATDDVEDVDPGDDL